VLQVLPHSAAAVAFVTGKSSGSEARSTNTSTIDRSGFHEPGQQQLLVALAAGKGEHHGLATAFSTDMNLCAEAATAPTQCLVAAPC